MKHDIPKQVKNSDLQYCISEYVRYGVHQDMLRDHWFNNMSLQSIAEKYHYSLTTTKDIVYGIGDDIIKMALEMRG